MNSYLLRATFLSMVLVTLSLCAQAAPDAGLSFSHNDWQLACDNTRTCRAAGYHSDDDELAVSVLLTRKAGPRQPVTGDIMIGRYDENEALKKLPSVFTLSMRINNRVVGQIVIRQDSLAANLSAKQVDALLAALPGNNHIEWVAGEHSWHLSDKGAAAVLLKMDEFQGRIDTQGALFKKGPRHENAVLPPLPEPVVFAAPLVKPLAGDDRFATENSEAIRKTLRATVKNDDCSALMEDQAGEAKLFITRLTDTKMLVSTECWSAAYNSGHGYWAINDSPPYDPVLVTTSGSEHSDGTIHASHKGRGLGDCWSSNAWTWNGRQFIHTASSSTGMCKLLAPGGAWSLPTIITKVRHSPP